MNLTRTLTVWPQYEKKWVQVAKRNVLFAAEEIKVVLESV